jgi:hypothetical protein
MLVVVVGLAVGGLLGDEAFGMDVQVERGRNSRYLRRERSERLWRPVCLEIDRHVNVTSLKLARENGQGRYL